MRHPRVNKHYRIYRKMELADKAHQLILMVYKISTPQIYK